MGSRIRTVTYIYLLILFLGTVIPFGSKISYTLSNNYVLQIRWDYLVHVILYLPMPVLLGLTFSKRPSTGTLMDSPGTLPDSPGTSSGPSGTSSGPSGTLPDSPSLSEQGAHSAGTSSGAAIYWLLVVGGSLILTFFYEALQLVIPYRYFNINDMVSNMVGVFIGLVVLLVFPSTLRRIQVRVLGRSGR